MTVPYTGFSLVLYQFCHIYIYIYCIMIDTLNNIIMLTLYFIGKVGPTLPRLTVIRLDLGPVHKQSQVNYNELELQF